MCESRALAARGTPPTLALHVLLAALLAQPSSTALFSGFKTAALKPFHSFYHCTGPLVESVPLHTTCSFFNVCFSASAKEWLFVQQPGQAVTLPSPVVHLSSSLGDRDALSFKNVAQPPEAYAWSMGEHLLFQHFAANNAGHLILETGAA